MLSKIRTSAVLLALGTVALGTVALCSTAQAAVGTGAAAEAKCYTGNRILVTAPKLNPEFPAGSGGYMGNGWVSNNPSQDVAYRAHIYRWDGYRWAFQARGPWYRQTVTSNPNGLGGTAWINTTTGPCRAGEHPVQHLLPRSVPRRCRVPLVSRGGYELRRRQSPRVLARPLRLPDERVLAALAALVRLLGSAHEPGHGRAPDSAPFRLPDARCAVRQRHTDRRLRSPLDSGPLMPRLRRRGAASRHPHRRRRLPRAERGHPRGHAALARPRLGGDRRARGLARARRRASSSRSDAATSPGSSRAAARSSARRGRTRTSSTAASSRCSRRSSASGSTRSSRSAARTRSASRRGSTRSTTFRSSASRRRSTTTSTRPTTPSASTPPSRSRPRRSTGCTRPPSRTTA